MELIKIQVLDNDARMTRLLVDEVGVAETDVSQDTKGTAAPEVEQFDVVLLSAEHPKAFAQCRRLKKSAALAEVPVVLYTFSEDDALLDKLAKHETLPSRADVYLLPPIDAARVTVLLTELLSARGGLRDTAEISLEPPDLPPEVADLPPEVTDLPPEVVDLPPEVVDLPPEVPELPPEMPEILPEVADLPPEVPGLPPEMPEILPEAADLPPAPDLQPDAPDVPPAAPLAPEELAREREELVEVLQGLLPAGEDSGPVDLVLRIGEEVERLRSLAGEGTAVAERGKELMELHEELVRLSPALDEERLKSAALTSDLDAARQQLSGLTAERDAAIRERADLLTEREVLRAERIELREARDEAVRRCQDLRDEHKATALEAQGAREVDQARLSDAQMRLVELQAQNAEAREQLASIQGRLITAERGLASTLERGVKLEKELAAARKVAVEAEEALHAARKVAVDAEEECADQKVLFERLEDGYRAELEQRDATIRSLQELDSLGSDRAVQLEDMLRRVRELAPNLATLAALAAALEPRDDAPAEPAASVPTVLSAPTAAPADPGAFTAPHDLGPVAAPAEPKPSATPTVPTGRAFVMPDPNPDADVDF
jgi:hypothetical protein